MHFNRACLGFTALYREGWPHTNIENGCLLSHLSHIHTIKGQEFFGGWGDICRRKAKLSSLLLPCDNGALQAVGSPKECCGQIDLSRLDNGPNARATDALALP